MQWEPLRTLPSLCLCPPPMAAVPKVSPGGSEKPFSSWGRTNPIPSALLFAPKASSAAAAHSERSSWDGIPSPGMSPHHTAWCRPEMAEGALIPLSESMMKTLRVVGPIIPTLRDTTVTNLHPLTHWSHHALGMTLVHPSNPYLCYLALGPPIEPISFPFRALGGCPTSHVIDGDIERCQSQH